jgi:cytochrome P450
VLSHADVDALLRHPSVRPLGLDLMTVQGITDGPLQDWWARIMFSAEGPDHLRLRRLVGRAFTPRAIDALRPVMTGITEELLDAAGVAAGPVDAVATVGDLPVRAMCALLGVPAADVDGFRDWSADLALSFGFGIADERARVEAAVVGLSGYVEQLLRDRRAGGGEDLLAVLLAAEDDGDRLTHDECVAMVVNLILAGTDTTRMQLAWALIVGAANPEEWARLATDPDLAATATAEVLRAAPAVPGTPRLVVEPFTLHERTFDRGELLSLSFLAANRDPAAWDDPDRIDFGRASGPAFTFGHGAHYCLGAALARAELEVALPLLARRWRGLQIAGPVPMRAFTGVWGPDVLPVTWSD